MAETWKQFAFADEVANLSDSSPASVGTAASAGVGTAASRDDHVHDLGADCIDSSDLIADDVIGSEHIKQLSAALDFGGQAATDMCIHRASSAPTAVVGKIYQDSDDGKVYICTAAS